MISSLSSWPFFSILLIVIGILIFGLAIKISISVQKIIPEEYVIRWRILSLFICFFIFGYAGYLFTLVTKISFPVELLITAIFFGGALFVYGVIELAGATIKRLHSVNESLENLVEDRTAELVKANLKLESSQEKYRLQNTFLQNILDSLAHPFYVIDVTTYEVVLSNKASGFSGRKEKTCHELTHNNLSPCSGEEHPCTIKKIRQTKRPAVLEHLHHDRNGKEITVEVYGYPIFDESGELIQVIEYVHDISDRKTVEKNLFRAKQDAEEANKIKTEFLANISHEIRTPMNAILGMTDLALGTHLTDEQRKYLQTVKNSSEVLLNLINDILDFSKIEAGRLLLDIRPFRLNEVISTTILPFQHLVEEKGIYIKVHYDELLGKKVLKGDDLRLRQILFNLIGNSVKFTDSGGVDVYCLSVGESEREVDLQFSVRDTGIGIERGKFETIFESFRQADASTTRVHGGTGLGLSICKLLISMMEGEIWVESTPGQGSVFYFELSFTVGGEQEYSETDRSIYVSPAVEKLDILVVDDIFANRDLVKMILERHDNYVAEAANGKEALAMLAARSYDVVLLDVQMPQMDGLETAEIIRSCERGKELPASSIIDEELHEKLKARLYGHHTPLLALTARATSDDRKKCLTAGMDDYIAKPFDPDEIISLIGRLSHLSN